MRGAVLLVLMCVVIPPLWPSSFQGTVGDAALPAAEDRPAGLPVLTGFTENPGPAGAAPVFTYGGGGLRLGLTAGHINHATSRAGSGAGSFRVRWPGSSGAAPVGEEELPHRTSFFLHPDPDRWVSGARSFRSVLYRQLWVGIDLRYRAASLGAKYEYVVHPGSSPNLISIAYHGADLLRIDADGSLAVETAGGSVRDSAPVSWQGAEGIDCAFVLRDARSVGFSCPDWDISKGGVIDPLVYATYLGDDDREDARSVQVDASGFVYVAGQTASLGFPVTAGAYNTTHAGGTYDGYIAKFAQDGRTLVYATFFGGSEDDVPLSLAIDAGGNAYVTGQTFSLDFPTTPGAFNRTGDGSDGFVLKLGPDGDALVYSTYLGGSGGEAGISLVVDANESAYVAGITLSLDFPVTAGAYNTSFSGGFGDAFAAKVAPDGGSLEYATFLGGARTDGASAIAVDAAGSAFVTGSTASPNFPVTAGSFDVTYNDIGPVTGDAFLVKLSPQGDGLVYSTYIGGGQGERTDAIAVDAGGSAYLTGWTESLNFPTVTGSSNVTTLGGGDAFVLRVRDDGAALLYGTYLGGTAYDQGYGIRVDAAGNAYVAGTTISTDFPVTPDAFNLTNSGGTDVFLARLDAAGATILNATYFGGARNDEAWGMALHPDGVAYVVGDTISADFPTSPAAFDDSCGSDGDCNFDGVGYLIDAFLLAVDLVGAVVDVTVDTVPAGLQVEVDGVPYTAPHTFPCAVTSVHPVNTPSPQVAPRSRHTFSDWSDGGTASHDFGCYGPTTLVATFASEHEVVLSTSPQGRDLLLNGSLVTAPQSLWFPEGSVHAVDAPSPQAVGPGVRYAFTNWSDGFPQNRSLTVLGPTTLVASFVLQYEIALDTAPTGYEIRVDFLWMDAPFTLWCDAGSSVEVEPRAPPFLNSSRAVFQAWSDGGGQVHSVDCDMPRSLLAIFQIQHKVRAFTVPTAREVTVAGFTAPSPVVAWCPHGSNITVAVPTPQVEGTRRYHFASWSDGSPKDHVQACDEPKDITATFDIDHLVEIDTTPAGLEVLVNGSAVTAPVSIWVAAGASLPLDVPSPQGSVDTRHLFDRWSDGGTQARTLVVDSAKDLIVTFSIEHRVTFETVPSGLSVDVDGTTRTTPHEAWWPEGSTHLVATPSPQDGSAGTRYVFASWSDGGANEHDVTASGPLLLTATFQTQHQLTLSSPYGTPACSAADCWYDEGATASFSVEDLVPDGVGTRHAFLAWTGDASGSAPDGTVMMDGPKTVTATWRTEHLVSVLSPYGSATGGGWYEAGEQASFAIAPTEVETSGVTLRFSGWIGDIVLDGSSGTVTVDGPKTIIARWDQVEGGTGTHFLIPAAVAFVALILLLAWRRRKRKEAEDLRSAEREDGLDLDAGAEG